MSVLTRMLTALAVAFFALDDVSAETGVGEAPRHEEDYHHVLNGIHAPRMAALGPAAIRFSHAPALGGPGFVLTFHAQSDAARVDVVWVYGHDGLGWRRTRARHFQIHRDELDTVAAYVDGLLARGDAEARHAVTEDGEQAILVCSDGPGYLTERNRNGSLTWMDGSCGNHPNAMIRDYLVDFVFERLGRR